MCLKRSKHLPIERLKSIRAAAWMKIKTMFKAAAVARTWVVRWAECVLKIISSLGGRPPCLRHPQRRGDFECYEWLQILFLSVIAEMGNPETGENVNLRPEKVENIFEWESGSLTFRQSF
jgi:hypothetical protein